MSILSRILKCHGISNSRIDYLIHALGLRCSHLKIFDKKHYEKCYEVLELPDGSDQETVRRSFIRYANYIIQTVKTQHQIHRNFNRSLQKKFASERWSTEEGIGEYGLEKNAEKGAVKEFDIKHTAPQHRQYLSYNGLGSGTPSQRESQYQKHRASVATANVSNHRLNKIYSQSSNDSQLIYKDKVEAKKIKTRYGIERLVEDLIQESMNRGEFDNLPGKGKPLKPSIYNPYVDFVTHKMNEIMIENGFVPEWIILQKEIKDDIDDIRKEIETGRKKYGPVPLSPENQFLWREFVEKFEDSVKRLNQKINKYNLVVPILNKQLLYFDLQKESNLILKTFASSTSQDQKRVNENLPIKENSDSDVFKIIIDFFQSFCPLFLNGRNYY